MRIAGLGHNIRVGMFLLAVCERVRLMGFQCFAVVALLGRKACEVGAEDELLHARFALLHPVS